MKELDPHAILLEVLMPSQLPGGGLPDDGTLEGNECGPHRCPPGVGLSDGDPSDHAAPGNGDLLIMLMVMVTLLI